MDYYNLTSDYTANHLVNCSAIPQTDNLQDNLAYLWGRAILHDVDRYLFLVFCPIVFTLQILILCIYRKYSNLMQKPKNVFFGIVVFELLINLHFFTTAIYYTIQDTGKDMPPSFPYFCLANSFFSSFLEILHIEFTMLFPVYIIYILRFTLKSNAKVWTFMYIIITLVALLVVLAFWHWDLLGLSIFGLCGISFIRDPNHTLALPIIMLGAVVIFLVFGLFTIRYFNKHMPNSVGLRRKKYKENKILSYYVIGFSIYLIANLSINIVELVNCKNKDPNPTLEIFITIFNAFRIGQFIFIFVIIFKNHSFRLGVKKFWKSLFSKNKTDSFTLELGKKDSFFRPSQTSSNYQQLFLDIKQQNSELDILKISQVVTIVSGIYVAYKQYYNVNQSDCRYFLSDDSKSQASSHNKMKITRSVRKIYYYQKMTIAIDSQIIKDYLVDLTLLPRLGILQCQMTIHAPKIFQMMLANDNLENIFQSFQLHDNTKKMFDLVEGQGGRSGQFFFFSYDNKYVLKTITQNEFQFLQENLMYFHEHYQRNSNSLLAKIYGLFTFKGHEIQRTYHLILMKNILACSRDQIIRTYDLKGSKYDRQVNLGDTVSNQLQKYTLKDIDFEKLEGRIFIKNALKAALRQIIQKDSIFLKNLNLLDYSLLIVKVKWQTQPKNPDFWGTYQRIDSSVENDIFYHIGIIDYLQKWDFQKKGQKWWKKLMLKKDISAQQPKKYQTRFMNFVNQIAQSLSLQNCHFELQQIDISKKQFQSDKQEIILEKNQLEQVKQKEPKQQIDSVKGEIVVMENQLFKTFDQILKKNGI